ncbi:hypothetical protein [Streptomyces katsurahamanus]|uniref:Uncharacterized protein n=1 Tax=Streptomyces katsurahamanus TaxID=2577098 RepID=A0ABW9NUF9_9ACTN|nr:hypothetical protein [Streptomyces katsurahamanus]MQS36946.1 hypothetical protein [Streptomyces katsurahamanus]
MPKEQTITRIIRTFRDQEEAQNVLKDAIEEKRRSNLSQALNAAYDGKGKFSCQLTIDGKKVDVWHASAGVKGVSSVTLFYFPKDLTAAQFHLIALAEHAGGTTYKIDPDFGQDDFPYKKRKTVGVDGQGER